MAAEDGSEPEPRLSSPRMSRRADLGLLALRLRHRYGGIEAINSRLLVMPRVEGVLAQFGASVALPNVVHGPLIVHNAERDYSNLTIGRNVHVGRLVILDLAAPIVVEDDCTVSMGTTILTHSDVGDRPLAARYPRTVAPARIGAGSYLGANVTVLAGCSIGREAVVGAGAVVTEPVPDGAVVAGVPARPL
jgi:acetyltransferase-like isoleucine patch superfamily enzyme